MRLTYVISFALAAAALGLLIGSRLTSEYANAAAYPLAKAHCVFEPVLRDGKDDIPGKLVTLVSDEAGETVWLMNANTVGPTAQVSQHNDGAWTATATFSVLPGAAMMTVNAEKRALLSVHNPDMEWSTQVGTCLVVQLKGQ